MITRFLQHHDAHLFSVFLCMFVLLGIATFIGGFLARTSAPEAAIPTIANLNARIRGWWKICALLAAVFCLGRISLLVLFFFLSLLALREYLTLIPTHRADHRTLVWLFFLVTPLQYRLIAVRWYGPFTVLLPAIVFLLIPTRIALAGYTQNFLCRAARIQFGLLLCTYCLSYAPALLILRIHGFEDRNPRLLLYLILISQLADILKYIWGKLLGHRKIVPFVSPNKTWEGFIGGVLSVTALGAALAWLTPFTPLQSAAFAVLIALAGAAGGLVMSAIKRDAGVKDFGALLEGHGGVLDRIDSLCFAAPVFFHAVRFCFAS